MLTGRPCFTDSDAIVVMARHIKTLPKPPSEVCPEAGVPADLEAALMRALAKDPNGRPASAEAMSQELARSLDILSAVTASGVRVSLSQSVRIVPSIPPMPFSGGAEPALLAAPPPRARPFLLVCAALVVVAVATLTTFLAIRQSAPPAGRDPFSVTRATVVASPPVPPPAPETAAPAVSPDSLPRASAKPPVALPQGRSAPKSGLSSRPSPTGSAAPRGSASPYGLFE